MDHFEDENGKTELDGIAGIYDMVTAVKLWGVDAPWMEFKTFRKDGEDIHYCNGLANS